MSAAENSVPFDQTGRISSAPGRECVADLRLDEVGLVVDVERREAQELESSAQQQVLTAIVGHQTVPVVGAVELEDETRGWVVQVGPSDPIAVIAEIDLDLRVRQAALEEKPSKSSLHWRLGGRRKCSEGPQHSYTGPAARSLGVTTQAGGIRPFPMQGHVDCNQDIFCGPSEA
jgi:hypothetical protein